MSEKEEKPGDEVVLGKKWSGEKFPTIASVATHDARVKDKLNTDENAVTLDTYFSNKRIIDPTRRAMMAAFTKTRKATVAAFDEIFSSF